jgi:hypothetical protein
MRIETRNVSALITQQSESMKWIVASMFVISPQMNGAQIRNGNEILNSPSSKPFLESRPRFRTSPPRRPHSFQQLTKKETGDPKAAGC